MMLILPFQHSLGLFKWYAILDSLKITVDSLHARLPDVNLWYTFPRRGQNKVNLHTTIKRKFGNLMKT